MKQSCGLSTELCRTAFVTSDSNSKTSAGTEHNFDLFARFIASDKPAKKRGPAKSRRLANSAIQATCEAHNIFY